MFDLNSGCLRRGQRRDDRQWAEQFPVERDPVYVAEHEAFLEAVAGRRAPESPARDALVSMQMIEAAMISWRTQTRVELPAVPE